MDVTETTIIRLNIERYRRMLGTEVDAISRRAIQRMLVEFEAKLLSATRSPDQSENDLDQT